MTPAGECYHDLGALRPDHSFGDAGGVRIGLRDAGAGRAQSPSSSRDEWRDRTSALPRTRSSTAAWAGQRYRVNTITRRSHWRRSPAGAPGRQPAAIGFSSEPTPGLEGDEGAQAHHSFRATAGACPGGHSSSERSLVLMELDCGLLLAQRDA